MASPFSVFRRNQKILLAISTVMIMLLFVIGDPLMKYINPHRGGQNPVVATTKLRSYHQADLIMLIQSRKMVENFLQLLVSEVSQKLRMSGQVSPRDLTFFAMRTYEDWRRDLLVRTIPPDQLPPSEDNEQARARAQEEAQAIQTILLADRAEEQGMLVSDRTVNDYLKAITGNMITGDEFQRIVSKLHAESGGVTQAYLFDALRRELLASRYSLIFRIASYPVPPAPRWAYFQRLNRRATAEVLGVSAEKFLKDVPEPKDSELLAFFNAHNQTIQVPESPEPGFKQPAKASFQFFKAKYTDFIELAQKEVTTEEMQEYYEKNKDIRFRERAKPAGDAAAPDDDSGAGSEKPDTTQPDATKPDATKPEGTKSDADKTDAGKTEGADKPAANPDKPAPPAGGVEKKSSSTRPASPFRPVALAQKSADAPAADAPVTDDSAAKPASTAGGPSTPADPASSATAAPDAKADAKPEGESADADEQEKPAKPELNYEPFEKVEDEIRKMLAENKLDKMVNEIFGRLTSKMREYAAARGRWEANREEDPSAEAPQPLDLPALAAAEGLTVGETGLVSAVELSQSAGLGQSYANVSTSYQYQRVSFVDVGYNERLLRPIETQDDEGDRYLSWKDKETPSAVPTLDEVRQEVVRAWKMVEARKRATAAAEQLAKEARDAKKPLSEVFADREGIEVVDTGPFSWMTIGAVPYDPNVNQPRLSAVHGVEAPGEDFMRAVFDSTPDQIRVVANQPQTYSYVVDIKQFVPDRPELEQQFIVEDFRKYDQLAFDARWNMYLDWLRWLDGQAGLTWVNTESTGTPTPATP